MEGTGKDGTPSSNWGGSPRKLLRSFDLGSFYFAMLQLARAKRGPA